MFLGWCNGPWENWEWLYWWLHSRYGSCSIFLVLFFYKIYILTHLSFIYRQILHLFYVSWMLCSILEYDVGMELFTHANLLSVDWVPWLGSGCFQVELTKSVSQAPLFMLLCLCGFFFSFIFLWLILDKNLTENLKCDIWLCIERWEVHNHKFIF